MIEGLLISNGHGGLELRIDQGGTWRLDAGAKAFALVGRRVVVEGVRSGFDLLDVTSVVELGA